MRAAAAGGGASWKSISLRVMSGEHHCKGLNAERREKATVAKNELQEMSCTCWLYRFVKQCGVCISQTAQGSVERSDHLPREQSHNC